MKTQNTSNKSDTPFEELFANRSTKLELSSSSDQLMDGNVNEMKWIDVEDDQDYIIQNDMQAVNLLMTVYNQGVELLNSIIMKIPV